MPAAQDPVEIAPVQFLFIKYRFVIGQRHRIRGKSHVDPVQYIALLAVHRRPVSQLQHLHVGGGLFQLTGIVAEIAPGTVLIADAKTHPIGPLLFDLPQGGPAAGAETAGRSLNAVAHQQIDHIHRQAQIVI